jgi:phytoene/squalene synthetase
VTSAGVGANPDGFLPALAANVMGLEDFAATTIEEWQNQLRQGVTTASAFLSAAIHQILHQLESFAEQIPIIGPTIAAVIMGFEGSLDDLATWFADLPGGVIDHLDRYRYGVAGGAGLVAFVESDGSGSADTAVDSSFGP